MSDSTSNDQPAAKTKKRKTPWNYIPTVPISTSPYFALPFNVGKIIQWVVSGWFPVSERLIILLLAIISSLYFHPSLATTSEVSIAWASQIYIRNFLLMCLVAGGLHTYFYIVKKQADELRFDSRPFATKSKAFTFNSQVRDNMFWTLVSGVTVWSAYEVLMMWALANNHAPLLSMPNDLVWIALIVFLLPVWETTHFFIIHRLIHSVPLYQRIHALHHRNTNVGPWSGLSMHPIEHIIYLSTVLIHFVVPSNPMLIIFHLSYFTLSAATTHTGYQGILWRKKLVLPLGTFHHQLHHRYFTCNYGGLEIPWDQWTGSFHDGSDASHQQFLEKRKNSAQP